MNKQIQIKLVNGLTGDFYFYAYWPVSMEVAPATPEQAHGSVQRAREMFNNVWLDFVSAEIVNERVEAFIGPVDPKDA